MKTLTFVVVFLAWLNLAFGQSYLYGIYSSFSGGVQTNVLTPVPQSGILLMDYNFFSVPNTMDVYYDNTDIFSSGPVSGTGEFTIPYGPGHSTDMTIVINQASVPGGSVWQYAPEIVPEPNSLWLLGLGFAAGVVVVMRRQGVVFVNCHAGCESGHSAFSP